MPKARQTLADYEALPEHLKADFVEGELVMAPAPTRRHERLLMRFVRRVAEAVGPDWDDRVFVSRFEIRAHGEAAQPDVVVLPAKAWEGAEPPPLLAAEILSPSTSRHDRGAKLRFLGRAGVHEAWILDPKARTIEVRHLASGGTRALAGGEVAESSAIPGLRVDVKAFFAE
jgi:Uma2 family endonuclease